MNFTKLFITLGILWGCLCGYFLGNHEWLYAAGFFSGTVTWFFMAVNEHNFKDRRH